jgi:hypothetical protein
MSHPSAGSSPQRWQWSLRDARVQRDGQRVAVTHATLLEHLLDVCGHVELCITSLFVVLELYTRQHSRVVLGLDRENLVELLVDLVLASCVADAKHVVDVRAELCVPRLINLDVRPDVDAIIGCAALEAISIFEAKA